MRRLKYVQLHAMNLILDCMAISMCVMDVIVIVIVLFGSGVTY